MFGLDWKSVVVGLVALPLIFSLVYWAYKIVVRHAEAIFDALSWVVTNVLTDSISTRMSLRKYCQTELHKESTKYLPVPGSRGIALNTDTVFIPLQLESAERSTLSSIEKIWDGEVRRVRIVGDPGSGKSSLVKRVFRMACIAAQANINTPLPIVVDLKDFVPPGAEHDSAELGKWALRHLRARVESVRGYDMGQLFDSSLRGRGLLVLLDGLDEVNSSIYQQVTRSINALSAELSNWSSSNRVALTMRTQFHLQIKDDYRDTFPKVFHIRPFSPGDIYAFLTRWPFPTSEKRASVTINRIYAELTDKPTLREMCSNPLILGMYVASDQSGEGTGTPDTRTAFYTQVLDELLIARRRRQLGNTAKTAVKNQREKLLGRLALDNLLSTAQTTNEIVWSDAITATIDIYGCPTIDEAAAMLREVCKETGVLSEERYGETLRFIHLTFCEFLAAKEAVERRRDGLRELIDAHRAFSKGSRLQTRTRLVEVIPFALGLTQPVNVADALTTITALGDRSVSGRCFLETQAYDHEAWKTYVAAESGSLIRSSQETWDESWLQRLHLLTVILADENEWALLYNREPTLPLFELFTSLIEGDKEKLLAVIGSYASFDPQASFRIAQACGVDLLRDQPATVIEHLSNPPFFSMIIERLSDSPSSTHEVVPLVLAEGALASPYVAMRLAREPATILRGFDSPDHVPRGKRWYLRMSRLDRGTYTVLKLSLLTYSLTLALDRIGPYAYQKFPRLSVLKAVKPPGAYLWARLARYRRPAELAVMMLTFLFFVNLVGAGRSPLIVTILGASAILALQFVYLPQAASAYFVAILVRHSAYLPASRGPGLVMWLYPGVALAYVLVGRRVLLNERLLTLRHLSAVHGHDPVLPSQVANSLVDSWNDEDSPTGSMPMKKSRL